MTTYAYGESSNNIDKQIQVTSESRNKWPERSQSTRSGEGWRDVFGSFFQCDLLTEDGGHDIDPTRLSYK